MKNTWTTKEGKTMLMSEMTDSHLDNAIAYVRKRAPVGYSDVVEVPDFNEDTRLIEITRKDLLVDFGYFKLLAEKRRREKR